MIYPYKYLPHRITKFHENIAYFFEQLVANDLAAYDENILLKVAFIPIINDSGKLVGTLREITRQYHLLSDQDKKIITTAVKNNNNIGT